MGVALLAEFNLFRDTLTIELDFGRAGFCWGKEQLYPLTPDYDTE